MNNNTIEIDVPVGDVVNGIMSFDHSESLRNEIQKLKKLNQESISNTNNKERRVSMNKYRVNYLLNESFHYSLVEAESTDAADELVYNALGEPNDYKLLGVEEDKTHLLTPGTDSGMAEIINKLIIDEWEAVSGYNSASVSAQEVGLKDAAELLSDLAKEEIEHVGELQQLLKSFDKNTHAIQNGEEEAKDKLNESFSSSEIRSVIKKYKKALDYLEDK